MSYKEDILKLRADGKSYGEISTILGCSKGTVAYYLKEIKMPETPKAPANSAIKDKVVNYIENIKETRQCIDCGQRMHKSQMDPVDGTSLNAIIDSVVDKETFEESKRKIFQLKFVCANCDRLRKFREANKGK
jgi:Zn ribbon nucleic-acid-binding protein